MNEMIEIIGSDDHRTRYEYTQIRPAVVQIVFLQHMVEERQSSTLSSHRAVTQTGEPDRIVIGVGAVFSDYTQGLVDTVVVDQTYIRLPDILDIRLVRNLQGTDRSSYGK